MWGTMWCTTVGYHVGYQRKAPFGGTVRGTTWGTIGRHHLGYHSGIGCTIWGTIGITIGCTIWGTIGKPMRTPSEPTSGYHKQKNAAVLVQLGRSTCVLSRHRRRTLASWPFRRKRAFSTARKPSARSARRAHSFRQASAAATKAIVAAATAKSIVRYTVLSQTSGLT